MTWLYFWKSQFQCTKCIIWKIIAACRKTRMRWHGRLNGCKDKVAWKGKMMWLMAACLWPLMTVNLVKPTSLLTLMYKLTFFFLSLIGKNQLDELNTISLNGIFHELQAFKLLKQKDKLCFDLRLNYFYTMIIAHCLGLKNSKRKKSSLQLLLNPFLKFVSSSRHL